MSMELDQEELARLLAAAQQDSALKARLDEIMQMPPEQQAEAIRMLSQAYEPMRDDLRSEITRNYDMLTAPAPEGQMSSSNQFGYYVGANPLEYLASGINKYQAGKGIREGREKLDTLSQEQGQAQGGVQSAMIQQLRAKALRGEPLTDEEKRRMWVGY